MSSDAISIYQDWLDKTAGPILRADLQELQNWYSLPFLYHSADNRALLETWEDMDHGHLKFQSSIRSQGVNHLIRLATDAEYLGDSYIQGHHVSHILRNATPVVPSYVCRFVLRKFGPQWKAVELATSLAAGKWPVHILSSPPDGDRLIAGLSEDVRREATQPLTLYQSFLDRLTRTNVSGDFDAYRKLFRFPLLTHNAEYDKVLREPEELRAFFDGLSAQLRDKKVDNFVRLGERAEFISGRELCGYHVGRFLRDGRDVIPPVRSRMILQREGAQWFMKCVTNSIGDPYPYVTLEPREGLVTQRQIQERTKSWQSLN